MDVTAALRRRLRFALLASLHANLLGSLLASLAPAARSQSPANESPLAPIITASRLDGVAPLPVFFDALATRAECDVRHQALLLWSFSDPGSSHATASGFCAGHVFETPGRYRVWLFAADTLGRTAVTSVEVNVGAFQGKTWYVSSSLGDDLNDGLAEGRPLKTFDRALQLFDAALPKNGTPAALRVLFKRGDVFPTASGYTFNNNRAGAPAIFGAWGSGPEPILWSTGMQPVFLGYLQVSGLRFVDLELRGSYDFATRTGASPALLHFFGGRDRCALRCRFRSADQAWIETGDDLLARTDIFMVDSEVWDMKTECAYLGGHGMCVLGNHMERVSDTHVLRVWYADLALIAENHLIDPSVQSGLGRHALKLHAVQPYSVYPQGMPTRDVLVRDNVMRGSTYVVAITPQNNQALERISDVVFERNVVLPDVASARSTSLALRVTATRVTVRNNVFVGDQREADYVGVVVAEIVGSGVPPPHSVLLFHNTLHHDAPAGTAVTTFCQVEGSRTSEVVLAHNVASAPATTGSGTSLVRLMAGAQLANLVSVANLLHAPLAGGSWYNDHGNMLPLWRAQGTGLDLGSLGTDPRFVNAAARDFHLAASSPARAAGLPMHIAWDDIVGKVRPFGGAQTLGAFE